MSYRIEKDTIGEVKVPAEKYWGAQTERSRKNFKIGNSASMPLEIIYGFAYLKKAAAHANYELGVLSIENNGPFQISGDQELMLELDKLLSTFCSQRRMKLSRDTEYKPCYEIVA